MYLLVSLRKYAGDFLFHETPEGDPVVCNEAAVFKHSSEKLFMYRRVLISSYQYCDDIPDLLKLTPQTKSSLV